MTLTALLLAGQALPTFHDGAEATAVPESIGWLALCLLVAGFSALAWRLFASELPSGVAPLQRSTGSAAARTLLGRLVLLSGVLLTTGGRWDELWHRLYGGFGDDFLWPPHLLIYGSLGLNGAFAALGLLTTLRGRGGLRQRFRAEPLLGLLGLLAAYQLASIPSDLLWHQIIGPDITAWSLPHLLLALTASLSLLAGLAIALSAAPRVDWRGLLTGLTPGEGIAVGLVAVVELFLLQIGTTEWEWAEASGLAPAISARPDWAYAVVALAVGIATAHLVLHGTRRFGAATAVAVLALAAQVASVVVSRAALPPGPTLAAHLLVVPSALLLDGWYAWRRGSAAALGNITLGIAIYSAAYFAAALLYLPRALPIAMPSPGGQLVGALVGALVGLVVALVLGLGSARFAEWLGTLGNPGTRAEGTGALAEG
jgi:hypothetical protein